MITLKTLPKATEQQIFDQVAKHLLTQNQKSERARHEGPCMYRNPEGLKCAVGCLISDKEYKPKLELCGGVQRQITAGNFPEAHVGLLIALQDLHDACDPGEWPALLKDTANEFNLSSKVVDSFHNGETK